MAKRFISVAVMEKLPAATTPTPRCSRCRSDLGIVVRAEARGADDDVAAGGDRRHVHCFHDVRLGVVDDHVGRRASASWPGRRYDAAARQTGAGILSGGACAPGAGEFMSLLCQGSPAPAPCQPSPSRPRSRPQSPSPYRFGGQATSAIRAHRKHWTDAWPLQPLVERSEWHDGWRSAQRDAAVAPVLVLGRYEQVFLAIANGLQRPGRGMPNSWTSTRLQRRGAALPKAGDWFEAVRNRPRRCGPRSGRPGDGRGAGGAAERRRCSRSCRTANRESRPNRRRS